MNPRIIPYLVRICASIMIGGLLIIGGCTRQHGLLPHNQELPRAVGVDVDEQAEEIIQAFWTELRNSPVVHVADAIPRKTDAKILVVATSLFAGGYALGDATSITGEFKSDPVITTIMIVEEEAVWVISNASLPVDHLTVWERKAEIFPWNYHTTRYRYPGVHSYRVSRGLIEGRQDLGVAAAAQRYRVIENLDNLWRELEKHPVATLARERRGASFGAFPVSVVAAKSSGKWRIHWGIGYQYGIPPEASLACLYFDHVDRVLERLTLSGTGFMDSADLIMEYQDFQDDRGETIPTTELDINP